MLNCSGRDPMLTTSAQTVLIAASFSRASISLSFSASLHAKSLHDNALCGETVFDRCAIAAHVVSSSCVSLVCGIKWDDSCCPTKTWSCASTCGKPAMTCNLSSSTLHFYSLPRTERCRSICARNGPSRASQLTTCEPSEYVTNDAIK